MYKVVKKLKLLKHELKKLNKAHFSDIENKVGIAQLRLKKLQEQIMANPGDKDLIQHEYEANQTFNVLYSAKMDYLKQKAKAHWLKDGDSNSAYFHGVLRARRNKNFICHINDQWNRTYNVQEGIQNAFLSYYTMLLGSKAPTSKVKKSIVRQGKVYTDFHRNILMATVTKEEVKEVIFQIHDDKAPGPDGFSSKFFKESWNIVGDDVTAAIMDFLSQA
ncbi:uncharacterized protein LOC141618672 [Silene latifolia]|uniref:uncharacterized protein LOC141618672 n=1 Tax=Silene latifolia TaxID=37657 RepID=UPI003D786814